MLKSEQKIAKERIQSLFSQAQAVFKTSPARARYYIQLARKIAMRHNVKLPVLLKRQFCAKCYSYLKPGVNCTIRTSRVQKAVILKCLECGAVARYPYRKEKH